MLANCGVTGSERNAEACHLLADGAVVIRTQAILEHV